MSDAAAAEGGRWRVTPLGVGDREAVRTLFGEVFGHPLSASMWAWKYAEGHGVEYGAFQGERLVAHYGGMVRELRVDGDVLPVLQIGDVMVDRRERGVLVRKGPFFRVTTGFFEHYVGRGRPYRAALGFPNQRHMRLGVKQGLYVPVERIDQLVWSVAGARRRWTTSLSEVARWDDDVAEAFDRLWREMLAGLDGGGVLARPAGFIKQRYFDHPDHRYRVFLVRRRLGRRAVGGFILRRIGPHWELLEVVAPPARVRRVVGQALNAVALIGGESMSCWITHGFTPRFLVGEPRVVTTDVEIALAVWTDGVAPERLRDRLWMIGGDTDFK